MIGRLLTPVRWVHARETALLEARLRDLTEQLAHARADAQHFRARYERLADAVLVLPGPTAPVHVEPAIAPGESLGARTVRVASLVGNHRGLDPRGPQAHARTDLPR